MSKFKLATALVVVLLASAPGAGSAQSSKITIATEGAYPPYNLTEPSGKLGGFEVDLAAELCTRMKVECTVVSQAYEGTIPALIAGKFDAIMSGMKITAKRQEVIAFSHEYADTPQGFLVRKSGPLATMAGAGTVVDLTKDEAKDKESIAALREVMKGKTVAVQSGTNKVPFLQQYLSDIAKVQQYNISDQMELDLLAGRVDAVFNEVPHFDKLLEKPSGKELQLAGTQFRGGILGGGVAVGLRKADVELKAKFDAAIASARADGTLTKIAKKWFTIDVTPAPLKQ